MASPLNTPSNWPSNSQAVPATGPKAAAAANPTDAKIAAVSANIPTPTETPAVSPLFGRKITTHYDARSTELKEKDSNLWICVSKEAGPNGGFIYAYMVREEFKTEAAANAKNDEIYPAIEPSLKEVEMSFDGSQTSKEFYNNLGFSLKETPEGKIFRIPDREALQANWSVEQKKRSELVKNVIVDLKQFNKDHSEFSSWVKGDFLNHFKDKFKDLPSSVSVDDCKEFFKEKWGNTWSEENIDSYLKEFKDFIVDRTPALKKNLNRKNLTDDKVWESLNQWTDNRYGDKGDEIFLKHWINPLEKKYEWLGQDFLTQTLPQETFNKYKGKEIPDEHWEKLSQRMQLPNLRIAEDKGIAGDLEFVDIVLNFDSLLSDKECIHDIYYHVMTAIDLKFIVHSNEEIAQQNSTKTELRTCYEKIMSAERKSLKNIGPKDIEKMGLALGILTDAISAQSSPSPFTAETIIDNIWSSDEKTIPNFGIWKKRYPDEEINLEQLKAIWQTILHS